MKKVELTYKSKGFMERQEYNLPLTREAYEHLLAKIDGRLIEKKRYMIPHEDVAKLSVVGAGMMSNPGVAAKMFESLYNSRGNINMISTSEIRRIHPVDIRVDLAFVRMQHGCKRNRSSVRTASSKGRHVIVLVHALKSGHNHDLSGKTTGKDTTWWLCCPLWEIRRTSCFLLRRRLTRRRRRGSWICC